MSDNMGYQPQVLSAKISREKEIAIMIKESMIAIMIKESFSGTSLQNHQD